MSKEVIIYGIDPIGRKRVCFYPPGQQIETKKWIGGPDFEGTYFCDSHGHYCWLTREGGVPFRIGPTAQYDDLYPKIAETVMQEGKSPIRVQLH